jgi:bacteriocin-like protein
MTSQDPAEKDPRPATASPANADAEEEAPPEIAQELTDEQLSSISGGTTSSPAAEAAGHEKWITVAAVSFK